jgi:hypothetical protein
MISPVCGDSRMPYTEKKSTGNIKTLVMLDSPVNLYMM